MGNVSVTVVFIVIALLAEIQPGPTSSPADETAVAWRYYKGDHLPRNYTLAAQWFRSAAEQGNPEAQYMLGEMLSIPLGVEKNEEESLTWYLKAAKQGHLQAQMDLAWKYANGSGVTKDEATAVKWCRAAADQDHPEAQMELSRIYYSGRGIKANLEESFKWALKSAEGGLPDGMIMASWLLHGGRGVEKNLVQAYYWCMRAINATEGAVYMIDRITAEMTPEQIAEADKMLEGDDAGHTTPDE